MSQCRDPIIGLGCLRMPLIMCTSSTAPREGMWKSPLLNRCYIYIRITSVLRRENYRSTNRLSQHGLLQYINLQQLGVVSCWSQFNIDIFFHYTSAHYRRRLRCQVFWYNIIFIPIQQAQLFVFESEVNSRLYKRQPSPSSC